MRFLKQFLNFYINASIHVAFAVCSLSYITLIKFNVLQDDTLLYFIFYATITGYNFVKYFGIAKFHHRRLTAWLKVIQIFSFICFLLLCYYAYYLETKTLICIVVFGAVTFFYATPILPKKKRFNNQKSLRGIRGLKVYIIAVVWSGVTVFLPVINNTIAFNTDVYITVLQYFIFVMVLMLPFEIRDLKYDDLKLSTIPQKIGIKQTKIIGVLLLMLFYFLEFFKNELTQINIIETTAVLFVTLFFLIFSNKKRSPYYCSFFVESIPIYWLLIIIILS